MLTKLFASTLILLCATQTHAAIPDVNDFRVVPQFPQPATGAFGVVGTATGDGRFILWDGDTVYLQATVGSHVLNPIATGYAGDPGFLALAPDGHTLLMGGGFNPVLYLLDLNAPADYAVGDEIPVPAHFSGAFLNENLVVLDRSTDDFSASELIVLDINDLMSPLTRSQVPFHSILEFPKKRYSNPRCDHRETPRVLFGERVYLAR